ncbi:MAG: tRNA 2-thiouridine(34) synthase MnmA [Candidatus Margulisiibacteriota bacterium]|nr:MAG: tRNA 2-thiouridine(34) synthase MnmA [Candidatus Margulisbacteria bacterium GWD2_39_127]OGI00878.1 MAG: tRNA 2-thiouridine(34) synthase MnmA [Candidatus Margulisbacteria bacterium GWF2_38_17]OGI08733.1 MAG: tRNA 2-thiouridine(34) synthase MnmA [Candidatus Margulisbacteria bacterium GWE2_39_32]PZM79444.1 MAG: tRNA 2-thiouridine(34) synthase MnmA [Candidatus Margulisiibacteriota bacterium]HAR63503.1 tRNA 2-thiouridine(34) synthase MnmA [Candidatus Margulisiibacteriota bacterium]
MDKGTVIVGMSGGIDSSVTAALLKDQGYNVIGVTMQIWDGGCTPSNGVTQHACYGPGEEEEIAQTEKISRQLGIPFHVIDLRKEYKHHVLDYFRQEYLFGRTPNPCIKCNSKIKFGALLDNVKKSNISFDYFATGHYVNVAYNETSQRYLLKRAKDLKKDQTYFLFYLSQEQLKQCIFPLGQYTKEEIREMSRQKGFGLENKPESQNFVAQGYTSLLEGATLPGPILDTQGKKLGEHKGIHYYTVGQRKRLGIAAEYPLYVVAIDHTNNAVVVGPKEDIYSNRLIASELNWISIDRLSEPMKLSAKIRYVQHEETAWVEPLENGDIRVTFDNPQMAITPGQAIVFYDQDTVVGGGIIQK